MQGKYFVFNSSYLGGEKVFFNDYGEAVKFAKQVKRIHNVKNVFIFNWEKSIHPGTGRNYTVVP
jgi:hypothetical protein